jgi:single-strand DNA-binding protein
MSLNKVMLIGNLGIDPVVKYLENNRVVAQFTLATNEAYLDKNGERKVETEWHNIEVWDQLAKSVDQLKMKGLLKKGTQVYVEGKIRSELYKDQNGLEVMRKKIKANQVQLLGTAKPPEKKSNESHTENNNV